MMTLSDFAEKIRESEDIVVFTGAGISTESGIPDFRSPGGIWTRYRPVTFQEYMSSEASRIEAWKRRLDGWEQYKNAKPNIGHYFVHSLDAKGKLVGLITQNVDGLHSRAGLPDEKIVELHVSAQRFEFLKLFPTGRSFSLQLGDARAKTLSLLPMSRLECVDIDLVLPGVFQLANLRLAVVELFS